MLPSRLVVSPLNLVCVIKDLVLLVGFLLKESQLQRLKGFGVPSTLITLSVASIKDMMKILLKIIIC